MYLAVTLSVFVMVMAIVRFATNPSIFVNALFNHSSCDSFLLLFRVVVVFILSGHYRHRTPGPAPLPLLLLHLLLLLILLLLVVVMIVMIIQNICIHLLCSC